MALSSNTANETAVITGLLTPAKFTSSLFVAAAVFATSTVHVIKTPVNETAVITSTATENRYVVIRETAVITGVATATIHAQNTAYETARVTSRVVAKATNSVNETAVVTGTAITGTGGANLYETAELNDSVAQTAILRDVLRESATLNDLTVQQALSVVRETAVITGTANSHVIAASVVNETALVSGAAIPVNHAITIVRESAALSGTLSDAVRGVDVVRETFIVTGHLIEPLRGAAWTAATDTFAMSRYTGYRFNSAAVIGGRLIAAGDAGLYLLAGNNDAGAPVVATLTTGLTDTGDPQQKRVREVFVGYEADGTVAMKVSGTGTGTEAGFTYTLPAKTAVDTTANRVKIGRGMRSRFWRFELSNPSGEPFKVTETRINPDLLSRKV